MYSIPSPCYALTWCRTPLTFMAGQTVGWYDHNYYLMLVLCSIVRYRVVPSFANHPVEDRFIAWTICRSQDLSIERFNLELNTCAIDTERWSRLLPGKFLNHTIFPAIRDAGLKFTTTRTFLRVRRRVGGLLTARP
jgi:hypothetical protein